MTPLQIGRIDAEALTLDPREAMARLGCPPEAILLLPRCLCGVKQAIRCRYAYRQLSILRPSEDMLDLGFGPFCSHGLTRNLDGCEEAFLFALTLGSDVDRLLLRLSKLSEAEHFVSDALASAFAEAACDLAESEICRSLPHRPRFSPGYGDLSLSLQGAVLTVLDAEKRLGITLSPSLLMSPSKSVTAIIGIVS